jgi:hypothetical protein
MFEVAACRVWRQCGSKVTWSKPRELQEVGLYVSLQVAADCVIHPIYAWLEVILINR